MSFAAIWMDLEIIILSKLGRDKYDIAYMWNLKKQKKTNLFTNRNRPTDIENELFPLSLPKRKGRRRHKLRG